MTTPDTQLLEEAQRTIAERQRTYGSPVENMQTTADLWSVWLTRRLGVSVSLLAEDVPQLMILLKSARSAEGYHRDNLTDTAGYAQCGETCARYRLEQEDDIADAQKQIRESGDEPEYGHHCSGEGCLICYGEEVDESKPVRIDDGRRTGWIDSRECLPRDGWEVLVKFNDGAQAVLIRDDEELCDHSGEAVGYTTGPFQWTGLNGPEVGISAGAYEWAKGHPLNIECDNSCGTLLPGRQESGLCEKCNEAACVKSDSLDVKSEKAKICRVCRAIPTHNTADICAYCAAEKQNFSEPETVQAIDPPNRFAKSLNRIAIDKLPVP